MKRRKPARLSWLVRLSSEVSDYLNVLFSAIHCRNRTILADTFRNLSSYSLHPSNSNRDRECCLAISSCSSSFVHCFNSVIVSMIKLPSIFLALAQSANCLRKQHCGNRTRVNHYATSTLFLRPSSRDPVRITQLDSWVLDLQKLGNRESRNFRLCLLFAFCKLGQWFGKFAQANCQGFRFHVLMNFASEITARKWSDKTCPIVSASISVKSNRRISVSFHSDSE